MRLLFVSPCVNEKFYGGVQFTAQLALDGLSGRLGNGTSGNGALGSGQCKVLCYGPRCGRSTQSGGRSANPGNRLCSQSKAGAVFDALQVRGWAQRLIFWHLDLVKLLPFLGSGARRKYLFLHGIECWRPIDGHTSRLVDRIDMFLTNSEFTWNRFAEKNPRWKNSPHRTIRLGIGTSEDRVEPPGLIPAAVIIGRMNAAEDYKGHRELIAAWPLVLKSFSDAELWIVGGGDAESKLKGLAAAGPASGRIRFFGAVSEEEKQRLLRQSRCLVLPSRGEGFGLVYLEAMRLGRPCLSSIHDAGKEVVCPPQAGIAVEPADTEALTEALIRLLTPGAAWQQWSADAQQRYESGFTAAHFQHRLLDALLENIVE
jgi:phosphatidylinositol alpha-1,6-mannosyltransferase